jgi:hypothetical protein
MEAHYVDQDSGSLWNGYHDGGILSVRARSGEHCVFRCCLGKAGDLIDDGITVSLVGISPVDTYRRIQAEDFVEESQSGRPSDDIGIGL